MNQEWISVKDRLPTIPDSAPSYDSRVRVIAAWGERPDNVSEMDYCRDIVRGREVYRFKWNGRISSWKVTHWMPLPEPPKQ